MSALRQGPRALERWVLARSPLGLVLAVLMLGATLAPSLLVRTWVFQGVLSGVGLAVGYGVGVALTAAGRWLLGRVGWDPPVLGARPRWVLVAVLVVVAALDVARAAGEHRWTWDRLGYSPTLTATAYVGAIGLALLTLLVLLVLAWLVRLLQRRVASVGARWLPAWVAGGLALVVVLWALLASANTWVLERSLDGMNTAFAAEDLEVRASTPGPAPDALRSGTPDSLVTWPEIGHEGRRFLTAGPTAEEIRELAPAGGPAVREPVRVYVGRAAADDVAGRVRLALAEMDRLGAFDRRAVLVVVPTGTGWVNEQIVAPPEWLLGGDVATVAVQYSHLPSPMAYLGEHEGAGETGRQLIAGVQARIAQRPATDRPALLVAGESLGSHGGSEAFTDLDDLVAGTRASLWIGPPEFMHLRREAERVRQPGSPQIAPVVGEGRDVVFANRRTDLDGTRPRSVFLQQADDPIVWWDVPTLWDRPDWLEERRDPAINPAISWRPSATFFNLTIDMAVANDFDEDHGHLYGTQPLAAWAAMLHPRGWDTARVEELRVRLAVLGR
ncbi:alpha/beta-hydrolase family protein [Nocardioides aurantiacus]|uniref:Putative membrane protein n=1 Tax=Nocardioides aurantiacus TaxID=86796 RepID=A0A3N2CZW0_9ACTN|nr:alpha/beta-hydrolase family protein [Nocardioides aurantiacus]ROR93049.1 putative membrane protein [Nocardioides aurantiacus]